MLHRRLTSVAFDALGLAACQARDEIPENSKLRTWMPAGMVTITAGNDPSAGGSNSSSLAIPLFVTGAKVTVDGKPIVENGKLVVGTVAM